MNENFDEADALWLRVVTPERIRLEVRAHWVQVPTVDGLLGIWPFHAPLLDLVAPGEIEYESEDGVQREWVEGGILHVRQNQVIILTHPADTNHPEEAMLFGGTGVADTAEKFPHRPNEAWEQSIRDLDQALGDVEELPWEAAPEGQATSSEGRSP